MDDVVFFVGGVLLFMFFVFWTSKQESELGCLCISFCLSVVIIFAFFFLAVISLSFYRVTRLLGNTQIVREKEGRGNFLGQRHSCV